MKDIYPVITLISTLIMFTMIAEGWTIGIYIFNALSIGSAYAAGKSKGHFEGYAEGLEDFKKWALEQVKSKNERV